MRPPVIAKLRLHSKVLFCPAVIPSCSYICWRKTAPCLSLLLDSPVVFWLVLGVLRLRVASLGLVDLFWTFTFCHFSFHLCLLSGCLTPCVCSLVFCGAVSLSPFLPPCSELSFTALSSGCCCCLGCGVRLGGQSLGRALNQVVPGACQPIQFMHCAALDEERQFTQCYNT